MKLRIVNFRDIFAEAAARETVRAFAIFSVLLLALAGIAGELVFRGLTLGVLRERFSLGRTAAVEIAGEVTRLGLNEGRIDYDLLRRNAERLRRIIQGQMEKSRFIRHVEVRDRWGVRIIFVPRDGAGPTSQKAQVLTGDWNPGRVVQASLGSTGSRSEGEVRLGIAQEELDQELRRRSRSLWLKIAVAGVLALGVLVVGLFYVLHLIRKNRNLERARQSAERASYLGLLASGLAHEIRNPLNAMNMNLQMLEEELHARPEPIEEEHAELLESTKSEIKRLERLVNDFLTFARPAPPRFETTDLNVVARDVIRLLEADFRQHRVELEADLEPLLPHVETDETQLKQALINLLVNARQVLEGGGRVTVRTRAGSRGEVVIEVRDNGPGIPEGVREQIFEVFYSRRGGGTGLGLPIAKQIVERHRGTIEVESVVGQGTTFRIRIPRHPLGEMQPASAVERVL